MSDKKIKVRPILFNTDMVKAIMSGDKVVTRRVVKGLPNHWKPAGVNKYGEYIFWPEDENELKKTEPLYKCPFGGVGDLLYVRETWATENDCDEYKPSDIAEFVHLWYEAGGERSKTGGLNWGNPKGKTRTSIHMPKWASRITLKIVSVKVKRLQDMTNKDAEEEGFFGLTEFVMTWEKIYNNYYENPFVWVVKFEVIKENVDKYLERIK